MTFARISIKKALQDRLKSLKKIGESYSDIIERLLNGQGNLQEVIKCYGIARGEHEAEIHDAYREAQRIIRDKMISRIIPTDETESS